MTTVDITIHQVQPYKYAATARRADGSVIQTVHQSSITGCIHVFACGLDAQTLNIYYSERAHVTTPRAAAAQLLHTAELAQQLATQNVVSRTQKP